jgi:predicted PurR-regulated permease PerM
VLPPLVDQVQGLIDAGAALVRQPGGPAQALEDLAARYGLSAYLDALRAQAGALPARLGAATGPLLTVSRGVVGSLTATVSILLLAFFLLQDGERFVAAGLYLVVPTQRPRLRRLLGDAARAVHGYITGNLTISLIAGAVAAAACGALGVPYAVALGLLVAVFDLIPLAGATLGAVTVLIVALLTVPLWKAGVLLGVLLLYQQVENNVLQPLVYGRSVHLHPLVIFLAVLAGAELLGILGALLAIPVAEILRILGAEWLATRAQATGGAPPTPDTAAPLEAVAAGAAGPPQAQR